MVSRPEARRRRRWRRRACLGGRPNIARLKPGAVGLCRVAPRRGTAVGVTAKVVAAKSGRGELGVGARVRVRILLRPSLAYLPRTTRHARCRHTLIVSGSANTNDARSTEPEATLAAPAYSLYRAPPLTTHSATHARTHTPPLSCDGGVGARAR